MSLVLEPATANDAAAIAALRRAVARRLAAAFGEGVWSVSTDIEGAVRHEIGAGQTFVARNGGAIVATLRLSVKNPWLGDTSFFTACARPLFLTAMAVATERQRHGIGRACLQEVERIARERNVDAIRLDAHDAPAGAGDFYRKCGFREVHRGKYHGTPLIWFERML